MKAATAADVPGEIFARDGVTKTVVDGNATLDVTSFPSPDLRFGSGICRSGAVRFDIDEPCGVDKNTFLLEGGVTLTTPDGTVPQFGAGKALAIPKDWPGTRETDDETGIRGIDSDGGSGL